MHITPLPASRWPDAPVRYPDPAVRVLDPRFERYRIDSAAVERIATGYRWAEGPVWFGDHRCLLWSDIPNNRMLRWDEETGAVTVFRSPSELRQRAHPRPPGPAGLLRAPDPTGDPHRARRTITVLVDQVRRQAAQRPQRRGRQPRTAQCGSPTPGYGILSRLRGRPGRARAADPGLSHRPRRRGGRDRSSSRWNDPTGCASPRTSRCCMWWTPDPGRDDPRLRHATRGGRPEAGCSRT